MAANVSLGQFWYNCSFHHNIGMFPYKALFGRYPPSIIPYELHSKDPPTLQDSLISCDLLLQLLKKNLSKARNFMKLQDTATLPTIFGCYERKKIKSWD